MQDFWPNIGRFVLYSVLIAILLAVLNIALFRFFGLRLGSGTNILSVMMPALFVGMLYGKRNGSRPETGALVQYSVLANLLVLILFLVVGAFLGALTPLVPMLENSPGLLGLILLGFFALYVLATFFFFRLGVRNQIKTGGKA